VYEGCEPLTPEDIAEVVVFAAGRRENVVVADTLVFPNHQVSFEVPFCFALRLLIFEGERLLLRLCTGGLRAENHRCVDWIYVSDWIYNRLVLEEATRTSALLNPKSRFGRYDCLYGKKTSTFRTRSSMSFNWW